MSCPENQPNCTPPSPFFDPSNNIDRSASPCPACDDYPTQKNVPSFDSNRKYGIGQGSDCDPMMRGLIVDDFKHDPERLQEPWMATYIPRYSQSKRGCDEAVKNLFENIVVIDDNGKAHPVPIIYGTQERAVAAMMQSNVRKDNSGIVDRLTLPMLSIADVDIQMNQERYLYHAAIDYRRDLRSDGKPGITVSEKRERDTILGFARGIPVDIGYTLTAWTLFKEDMNQIYQQIVTKFSPIAYIKVQGVHWESIVKCESTANNENLEPGDTNLRIIRWQFNLKAETFIPQPIVRKKSVLETIIDEEGLDEDEIRQIIVGLESL